MPVPLAGASPAPPFAAAAEPAWDAKVMGCRQSQRDTVRKKRAASCDNSMYGCIWHTRAQQTAQAGPPQNPRQLP